MLQLLRERARNNQRRYRSRQRERLREAEEHVARLTAQLEASKLEQVRALNLLTLRFLFSISDFALPSLSNNSVHSSVVGSMTAWFNIC